MPRSCLCASRALRGSGVGKKGLAGSVRSRRDVPDAKGANDDVGGQWDGEQGQG